MFSNVLDLPQNAPVFDLSMGGSNGLKPVGTYGIGKYGEKRPGIYSSAQYRGRDIHVGIDLFAPSGTPVKSVADGKIYLFGNNDRELDYGYTIITEHELGKDGIDGNGLKLYALYGHLSARSIENKVQGQSISSGQIIAWLGDRSENGGWQSHLHFQLSYERPQVCDFPGVVHEDDWPLARLKYPDPRLVLGPLYS